jgi:formylglycine-generating enzyme required for sulfatase activity
VARYFFSYSGIDRPLAAQIVTGLQGAGMDVFWDQTGIGWGEDWIDKLAHELTHCEAYILLLGPQGIQRWVEPELKAALCRHFQQGLPLFTLLHASVNREQIPLFLNFSQHQVLPVALDDPAFFSTLIRNLQQSPDASSLQPEELPADFCPYPGLESFNEKYAHYFFGRQFETAELLISFSLGGGRHPQRWLQIEGNSGVGKSSLVQSGLIPAIRDGWQQPDYRRIGWHIAVMRPGNTPCENLAVQLRTTLAGIAADIEKIRDIRRENPRDLAFALKTALPAVSNRRFLLVVDQLEEVITLTTDIQSRDRFDALLADAINDRDCPFHLVTTIRSDFMLHFSELPRLQEALQQSTRYFLKPISAIGLKDAVETPLRRAKGWSWPSESYHHQGTGKQLTLAEIIVADALEERDTALPLASNVMNKLWQLAVEQGRRQLSMKDYLDLHGVGGALASRLDTALTNLPEPKKSQARAVLLALVQDNQNAPDTRRSISKTQALAEATLPIEHSACKAIWIWLVTTVARYLPRRRFQRVVDNSHSPERILDWLSGISVDDIRQEPVRMIVVSGGREHEAPVTDPKRANDAKTVDLIHEILLRKSRSNDKPYCDTLYQWLQQHRQQLKDRNLREQLTKRWLEAKTVSRCSAWFNDLANPKQLRDFRHAGSFNDDERAFLRASAWRLQVFNVAIVLLVVVFFSLGFAAGGVGFSMQKTNIVDLPIAWLRARLNLFPQPDMLTIRAGTLRQGGKPAIDIPAFNLAQTETTFAEYDVFVFAQNPAYATPWTKLVEDEDDHANAKPCMILPDDQGWGRGSRPVINVSWDCAKAYIEWLNSLPSADQEKKYKLPTEQQWEYAIRGGTTTAFFWETEQSKPGDAKLTEPVAQAANYAWYADNSSKQTHPVAKLKANPFGLYDMAGNVWEWTDSCGKDDSDATSSEDANAGEQNADNCTQRVLRGGSWYSGPDTLRSADRHLHFADLRGRTFGFRLAQD